jgi:hypothetical protein
MAPLANDDPVVRPMPGNLDGNRLTARIDGPSLSDSDKGR